MKMDLVAVLSSFALLVVLICPVCCQHVDCRWGSYGEWSECDGCSRTKVRTRHVELYAQFGGAPCSGEATQAQPCVSKKGCPLATGCGDRFRCTSGQCISQSLVCNGDHDCEDGLDERNCDGDNSQYSCDLNKTPPNSGVTGRGYNVLTGQLRAGVINTLSFGGQCRKVFSGDHQDSYRLPQNILRYNFEVTVENEDSDESYDSSWSYIQHIQANALVGHDRRSFHKELTDNKAYRLIILKNKVELAQFQNSAPQYLTLAEGFWKALSSLPYTYDYSAYRQLFERYGTHYLSEGKLGGEYQGLLELDRQALDSTSTTNIDYQRCWRKVKRRFFRKKVKTTCEKLIKSVSSSHGNKVNNMPIKVKVFGGDTALTGALTLLDLDNPEANGEIYDNWASSVKDFPEVIDMKLRPLYELVKEVQCAGLKKVHLKRALEEYLSEEHPCHCGPCQNNGKPLLTGSECHCACRPGTSGHACEQGAVIGEQPGVIDGSWTCWSSWGTCIGNIQYLQTMEPQCFDLPVTPPKTCGAPPNLRNGYIEVNPRDFYLVGNTVQYSCIDGYYLIGGAVAQCTETQKWRTESPVCKSATWSVLYAEEVSEIMCSPSLQWSPSPASAHCKAVLSGPTPPPGLKCKPWENIGKTECVCKMPSQCSTSLQLCARLGSSQTRGLSLCQLGALRCLGRSFELATDCDGPQERPCPVRTANQGQFVRNRNADDSVAKTMTECEVGARRCANEQVHVVGIEACPE
ncbi:Complement component C7 [Dissostichus eleginoides]|uniref:Complement component C7 n=1 Tax=Dissostichus eleginoides TaxID=100907 RepID=A0AAD9BJ83_DISEL|nr:Complement component C7 [Dissostichus eleginoides]